MNGTETGLSLQDLKNCAWVALQIDTLEEMILRLQRKVEFGAHSSTRYPDSENEGHVENCAAAMDALEQSWHRQVAGYCRLLERVEQAIGTLPGNQAAVLRLRYVQGLPWREVAARTHYNESWCRKLERTALKRLPVST